ncbi:MAG: thiamine monophosphate synthase [Pelagibacterales bacterium MED-G44]|nr:MAG: thiamine monophosphate synthase [Pelagibacterales bacterium MED-G44]
MQKKSPYVFYFIDRYNIEELTNLEKNIDLIFRNYSKNLKIDEIKSIQRFCKTNKRNFYLSNNIKLALKLRLNGVYIPSFNKSLNFTSKYSLPGSFEIIGSAHNLNQIRIKKLQKCSKIFLSPIFKSKKNHKFLSTIKFNFMTMSKNIDFIALGGINENNYKKLKLTKVVGFAGISWIKKNGLRKLRPFL